MTELICDICEVKPAAYKATGYDSGSRTQRVVYYCGRCIQWYKVKLRKDGFEIVDLSTGKRVEKVEFVR